MSVSSEPPPTRQRPFAAGIAVGLLVALLVAVIVVGAIVVLDDDTTTTPAPSPTQTPTPSASPSPTPSPNAEPLRQVEGNFHDQNWLRGDGLWMFVGAFALRDDECTVHTFTYADETLGAYRSDCQSWENDGYDILLFTVGIRNPTRRAVTFDLRNFVLTARDTRTFGSVNVRSQSEFPPNFLPENAKIPPRSNLVGYLTFDGRVTGLVPAQLNYVNGRQTLSVVFDGKHSVS